MNWPALVAAALALWGWTSPTDISVRVDEEWGDPYKVAYAEITPVPGFCTIHISPLTFTPYPDMEKLITHEVGHCLGLRHIDGPGIMTRFYEDWPDELSGYDRADFWWVYPPPNRVFLPMVVQ